MSENEKEIVKFLVSSELGASPDSVISEKCKIVLSQPLAKDVCYDFKGIRQRVLCRTWQIFQEEKTSFSDAIRKAWREMKEECSKIGATI